ncbi:uncharacterized protein LOC113315375 [Papaver somniferum]|uniref:uncharacterized protein LOC113315375 n=1 Tax=Papaver somniferum TaxID=3469 RepID=UPI000E6FF6C1|nr:uncharacterized protein LOC113315375 [Papaver somniferum]
MCSPNEEGWYFPDSMDEDMSNTVEKLKIVELDQIALDTIVWKPSASGAYTMKDTYKCLDGYGDVVQWQSIVWFKSHVPRNSFITWLALHGRLKTKEKMVQWGLSQVDDCKLCEYMEGAIIKNGVYQRDLQLLDGEN